MFKRLVLLAVLFGCFGVQLTSHAAAKKASAKRCAASKEYRAKKAVAQAMKKKASSRKAVQKKQSSKKQMPKKVTPKKQAPKKVVPKASPKNESKKPVAVKKPVVNGGTLLACVIDSERSLNQLVAAMRRFSPDAPEICFVQMFIEQLREARLKMYTQHVQA